MQPIQEDKKKEIINLYFNEEKNLTEISNITKVNRMTVAEIVKKYKEKNNIDIITRKVSFWKEKKMKKSKGYMSFTSDILNSIGITENKRNVKVTINKNTKKITLESSKKNEENKD